MMASHKNTVTEKTRSESFADCLLIFSICSVLILCFEWLNGAFHSDLGGDPDEAAHAVTALMLRDYMVDGLGQSPMNFARLYYEAFPRVALGHYPPLYYIVAAPWLLLGASTSALFVLQALTLAGLATLTYHLGRRLLPKALAAAAGMGVIALPLALKLSLHVMSDVLLALLCLWAAILWAWYLRMPSIRRALVWGCVAATAILTKGSGIGLCLLPPVATLLAGKWRLCMTAAWWCSALPVAVLAAPWMLYSTGISKEGMTQLSPWQYFLQAVPYHLKAIPAVFGWPFTLLASAGIVGGLITGWRRNALLPETSSLTGMTFGMTAVLLLVPVGLSTRYMLTLAPAMLLAAAAALHWFPWRGNVALLGKALSIFACNLLLIPPGILLRKEVNGFHAAVARSGISTSGSSQQSWLVASDPCGEGAVIAAAAFECPQRSGLLLRVYRASKELSSSDWMGRGYHTAFNTPKELLEHLDRLNITRVFLDQSMPTNQRTAHERLLEAALDGAKAAWALDFEQTVSRSPWENGRMRIYQRL
jgi:hypothetical protein